MDKDTNSATVIHEWMTELTAEAMLKRLYELMNVLYERCEEEIEPYQPHKRVTGLPNDPLGG